LPATQNTSYARSYEGWNPSIALSYRPDNVQTYFAAVSRSFEPPTHDDLLATVYGTPNSSPGTFCQSSPESLSGVAVASLLHAQPEGADGDHGRGRLARPHAAILLGRGRLLFLGGRRIAELA
jgi:iron complex outermembrane receptor protein